MFAEKEIVRIDIQWLVDSKMTVHSCAFKYPDMRTTIVNKDLEMEMKMFVEEVAHLEREIIDLKNDIYILRRMNFL